MNEMKLVVERSHQKYDCNFCKTDTNIISKNVKERKDIDISNSRFGRNHDNIDI